MITLQRDTLSFTFPKVARQVRSLIEQKIHEIASELPPLRDRAGLWAEIESSRNFHTLTPEARENARAVVHTWTPARVEGALCEAVINRGGLDTDAFTELTVKFQRTTRIPEDGKAYRLPMGLGQLRLCSVDDFPDSAPATWMHKGGVIMSLARSEAMSIWFSSHYRFAVKIGTGRINALSDEPWSSGLRQQLTDYVVAPGPPWSENDEVLRRYVALPLRTDLSTDGHSDRMANVSGIVLKVAPMLAESYYRDEGAFFLRDIKEFFMRLIFAPRICAKVAESHLRGEEWERRHPEEEETESIQEVTAHQEVLEDPYALWEWDQAEAISCCIHPCDESLWRRVTGTNPWHPPLTAEDYRGAGIPWLDNYRDAEELLDHDWSVTLTHSVPRSETSRRVQIRELPDPPHNAVKP